MEVTTQRTVFKSHNPLLEAGLCIDLCLNTTNKSLCWAST